MLLLKVFWSLRGNEPGSGGFGIWRESVHSPEDKGDGRQGVLKTAFCEHLDGLGAR